MASIEYIKMQIYPINGSQPVSPVLRGDCGAFTGHSNDRPTSCLLLSTPPYRTKSKRRIQLLLDKSIVFINVIIGQQWRVWLIPSWCALCLIFPILVASKTRAFAQNTLAV